MASIYRTIQGDTWDIISKKAYDSEKYVDVLITQNYTYRSVVFFSAGVELTIPTITTEQQQSNNLPPWRRSQ